MAVQMGQLRFTGISNCVSDLAVTSRYISIPIGGSSSLLGGDDDNSVFQDVVLETGVLNSNNDYHLQVLINRDLNYDMIFNIKLVSSEDNYQNLDQYQFLKQVEVKRGLEGVDNTHIVVLYEKSNGSVAAMIPLPYQENITTIKDALYLYEKNYYLGNGMRNGYIKTTKYNDVILAESWKREVSENSYGIVDFVFRPVQSGFDAILIEMVRNTVDFNIQEDIDGQTIYGRKISDAENMSKSLQLVKNQLENIPGKPEKLKHIGIWSHSNLMMAINGEEIHIGQSGFYELDATPITSVGIVTNTLSDTWTMDYTY